MGLAAAAVAENSEEERRTRESMIKKLASCNFESQTHRELVRISMAVWAWNRGLEEWAWQRRWWRRTQKKNEERESR
jgi:hypothetical protein